MSQKIVSSVINIKAPIEKVWDALVNPEQTKKYMFGCETVSDWKIGNPLLWKGSYEGTEMVFVKGVILEMDAPRLLKYTVIDPNNGMEDIPTNYLNVTYSLTTQNDETLLTVLQDGFEHAADGEKRYQETYNNGEGWNPILTEIKKLVESEIPS